MNADLEDTQPTVARTAPTQSAWTQPASTAAAPGYRGAARPVSPRTTRLVLGGGGAVVVIAAIVAVVLATSGGGSTSHAFAPADRPSTATATPVGGGKVFTHVPAQSCALLSQAIANTYLPRDKCQAAATDGTDLPGMIVRQPDWNYPGTGDAERVAHIQLVVGSTAADAYNGQKSSDLRSLPNFETISDQHAVTGLGDQAYIIYSIANAPATSGDAEILVLEGNAMVEVEYQGANFSGADSTAISREQAETAVTALARDVLSHLS